MCVPISDSPWIPPHVGSPRRRYARVALPESDANQFATARAIAERWDCHVDTVYSRLAQAGVPTYRFTARLVRWRWTDIFTFEDSLTMPRPDDEDGEALNYVPRKRGPRNLRVVADE